MDYNSLVIRPRKKRLTYRRRHNAVTSLDIETARSIETAMQALMLKIRQSSDFNYRRIKMHTLVQLFNVWRTLLYVPRSVLRSGLSPITRTNLRIGDLTDEDIPGMFRFMNKQQVLWGRAGLRFPRHEARGQ